MAALLDENSIFARSVRAAVKRGTLSHAVIIAGTGDKCTAARYLAAAYLCNSDHAPCFSCNMCRKVMEGIHPDVTEVEETEKKELPVETVRALRSDVYISPNEGKRKVYIFADCDQLNARDQDVLLKIVEEGPDYAAFIFCTETAHALLPTIRSRCTEMKLHGSEESRDMTEAIALLKAACSQDRLYRTAYFVNAEGKRLKREQLQGLLQDAWRIGVEALKQRCGVVCEEGFSDAASVLKNLSVRQISCLIDTLQHFAAEVNYNVGTAQVLGALLVCLNELEEIS